MSETPEEVAELAKECIATILDPYDCDDALNSGVRLRTLLDTLVVRWRGAEERVRKAEEERDEARERATDLYDTLYAAIDRARKAEEEVGKLVNEARHKIGSLEAEIERLERIIAAVPVREGECEKHRYLEVTGGWRGSEAWLDAIAAEQKRIRARDTSAILDHLGFEREEGA